MADISDLLPPPPTSNGASPPTKSSLRSRLPMAVTGEGAPKWAAGIQIVIIALVSIFTVMGLDAVGPGLVASWRSRDTVQEMQQLSINTMLQSIQASNQTLQSQLVDRDARIAQLEKENRELQLLLQYRCSIETTPVPTVPPVAPPGAILVPTPTFPANLIPAPAEPQG